MRVHFSIAVFAFSCALLGCRTVWVHENWEPQLFEKDYSECRTLADEGRTVTSVHTRKCTVDEEAGEETCIEEHTKQPRGRRINWKRCMLARGWEPTTELRSSPISRPKRHSSTSSRKGK